MGIKIQMSSCTRCQLAGLLINKTSVGFSTRFASSKHTKLFPTIGH